jgi:hypothetical protein
MMRSHRLVLFALTALGSPALLTWGAAPPPPRRGPLPARVDNSVHKYFPPILRQRGGSCAQVTAIQNLFAYEINLLRDRSSHEPRNQYPAHFTWLCLNDARGTGSSASGGWIIAREMGVPTLDAYGDRYGYFRDSGWMSGYDRYFQAMHNRVESWGTFPLRTPEDLRKVKAWLHNHDDPAQKVGGLLYFLALWRGRKEVKVPAGQYEAGKTLYLSWGEQLAHAMTLVGYDDDVGYDVNGDGLITNDVDLDGDGKLTLADHERGAFLFANSKGTDFGDSGKAYVLYRVWGLKDGGARPTLYWVKPKKDYRPTLTLKLRFSFSDRSALRLSAGFARDPKADAPDRVFRPAVFNGRLRVGSVPMRGRNNPDPIEIGLDLSHLADSTGGPAGKFFLTLDRRDGSGAAGELLQASVRSYHEDRLVREHPFVFKEGKFGGSPLRLSLVVPDKVATR